jgi:enoyl-CoA hydratase/carnithine racemase
MATVTHMAEQISLEKSSVSISAALEAVTRGMEVTLEEGLKREAELFGKLFGTADMKEGVMAFIEKRKTRFIDQ